jgi:hypothetical protein
MIEPAAGSLVCKLSFPVCSLTPPLARHPAPARGSGDGGEGGNARKRRLQTTHED